MAMDIELRNQLGALTAQVQELTKQSKTLDGTLAGALDKGAKSAGKLASGARTAREEITLAEQVSTRVGRAFTQQMFSLATGALGVTAIWQSVSSAMDRAQQRLQNSGKATADFTSGTRLPGDNPAMRRAMRETATFLTPDEQSAALKAYRKAGGSGEAGDVRRLGTMLDQGVVSGIDPTAAAGTYAKLRKAGIENPEDVIASATLDGTDLDKLKPGALRAYAAAPATKGAAARMASNTKLEEVDRLELTLRAVRARRTNAEARNPAALKAALRAEVGASVAAGTPGAAAPLVAGDIQAARDSAEDMDALRAEARAQMGRETFGFMITDAAVERRALSMQKARRTLPASASPALSNVQRVVISGDDRPVPVDASGGH